MNALTTVAAPLSVAEIARVADAVAKSGLFGIKTPDQALALMMIAQAEGRHPALAARDYDVIQGRPAKKAEAMLRDFLEAGGKVEWHTLSDEVADATFSHQQGGSVRITWDIARANKAGLGGKSNWKAFPRQMLRSRTVSEGVRTIWPMATSGMYVPEEARDHPGPTIDHDAEPEASSPAPQDARDAINAAVPIRAAAAATPPSPRRSEAAHKARTDEQWKVWVDKLRDACAVLYHRDEVVEVGNRPSVGDAIANGPPWVQREISSILAQNYARFPDEQASENDLEIIGEDKMASGDD
jgi:hypothetical protein